MADIRIRSLFIHEPVYLSFYMANICFFQGKQLGRIDKTSIQFRLILNGEEVVAFPINFHEQTQSNRVCCILNLLVAYFWRIRFLRL